MSPRELAAVRALGTPLRDGTFCFCGMCGCEKFRVHPLSGGNLCVCYFTRKEHEHSPACAEARRILAEAEAAC